MIALAAALRLLLAAAAAPAGKADCPVVFTGERYAETAMRAIDR